jgi:hypothetical protein
MTSRQRFPFAFVSITCLLALMLSVQTSSADEEDLIKLGNGLLQKVIVSDDEAKLFPDGPGEGDGKPIEAYSIYFKLKGSDDGFVRVGDNEGKEAGWIDEKMLIEWNTRLLLLPKSPDPKTPKVAFTVINDSVTAIYTGKSGGDKKKVAAPILEPVGKGTNPDYEVAYFAGNSTAVGAKGPVGAPSPTSSARRKTEIVFVIDTTASMDPLIDGAKDVTNKVSDLLAKGGGEAAAAVKFGLVQYRDLTAAINFSGEPARLETALTDVKTFQTGVRSLATADLGSGETKEDVLAGLLVAIGKAGWSENSSKHIVLMGDASAHVTGTKNSTGLDIETIIGRAQQSGGSDKETKLGTIYFHVVQANYMSDPEDTIICREQFKTLAANADKFAGYYTEFNPNVPGSREKTVNELSKFLGGFVSATMKARKGDIEGLEKDASGTGVAAIPAKAHFELIQVAGGPPIKTVERGVAKLRSDDGDLLAQQMVLVSEIDLRRLRSTLDLLEVSFGRLTAPNKRKDVGKLLESLKETLILNLVGQKIDENTVLADVITALPLRTDVLKTTALDLQKKDADSFKKWIEDLVAAKIRTDSLIEDEKTDWHQLANEVANTKYAYILIDNMP